VNWQIIDILTLTIGLAVAIVMVASPGAKTTPHAPKMSVEFVPKSLDEWLAQADCPVPCRPLMFRQDGHSWEDVPLQTVTYTAAEQCHLCGARRAFRHSY
jgi:hypothetical protein